VIVERHHHRGRDHHTKAGIGQKQPSNHNRQRSMAQQGDGQQQQRHGGKSRCCDCHHPAGTEPLARRGGELG